MPGKPGINAFIDDFKVHGEALEEGTIQAECQGALGKIKFFFLFFIIFLFFDLLFFFWVFLLML